ncbi:hypothetical protein CK203_099254 [Vitis vinifera]|uniref:Uncharacterized protein n=1 Tax=Vitis vinifera TaxID=29760 RepID=A0A438CGV4_VITVI|nr:hypothetical protein CK203_099254 [Vitis vinifera]
MPAVRKMFGGWSLITKLMPMASGKGQKIVNEVGSVDVAIHTLQEQLHNSDAKESNPKQSLPPQRPHSMKLATKFCTSPNWSWTHGIRILEGFADVPKPHDNVAAEKATMEMTILALCMTQTKGTKGTTPSIQIKNWQIMRGLQAKHIPSYPLKIQQELNNLRALEPSSTLALGKISTGLSGLQELHQCLEELLNLYSTQQALSHHQDKKWVDELLDGSVKLLDICGATRDVISQFKENVGDLQSALRRRKGDVCIESSINNYIYWRKKMNKDAKRLLAAMKKMYNKGGASPLLDQDHHLSTMMRELREVNIMSISIFQSLVLLLSTPVLKPKLSAISSEEAKLETMEIARKRLEGLEVSIEGLDKGLECMYRRLVKQEPLSSTSSPTRAMLIN